MVLKQNYRSQSGEIDIIASHRNTLVFVEVKSRTTLNKGSAEEAVGRQKQKKIIFTAFWYLREHGLQDVRVRFDVLTVNRVDGRQKITLYENAFQAQGYG